MASNAAGGPSGGSANQGQPPTPSTNAPPSQQNLNSIVIEYLNKKGYTKTEATLRVESANMDENGRPKAASESDDLRKVSDKAYSSFKSWIEGSLDLYRPELRRMLYPVFVHIYLGLIANGYVDAGKDFYRKYGTDHELLHADDLRTFESFSDPAHVQSDSLALLYKEKKYRIRVTTMTYQVLNGWMEENDNHAGRMIIQTLNDHLEIIQVPNTPMLSLIKDESVLGDDEGIPGHGTENIRATSENLPSLKLGHLPMEKDFIMDVEEELMAEDTRIKEATREAELGAGSGTISLLDTFQQGIKREETEDSPMRDAVPLPPYKGVDIKDTVMATKEHRQRFRFTNLSAEANARAGMEGAIPGLCGPLPSCVTYTFHNTANTMCNMTFSKDFSLVAAGFTQSYVRIWSTKGEPLKSLNASDNETVTSSRTLIGHSGSVYGLSISPDKHCLLSSSADGSVRMWSLDTYTALVAYKGHNNPVWDVAYGPFGQYFATASRDKTARLWSCDHIGPLRIFAGHSSDVDRVAWHPNNNYLFTASNDRTLRMWDISSGNSVRLFNGHTSAIDCLEVSPNGRYLASGGNDGLILIWDIASGRRIKSLRGHAKQSPVYSVTWSVDSDILVSGGADQTIRVWNMVQGAGGMNQAGGVGTEMVINGIGGIGPGDSTTRIDGVAAGGSGSGAAGQKGKGKKDKNAVITSPEHLTVYYTKKTNVLKVKFTPKNCVIAGGTYLP